MHGEVERAREWEREAQEDASFEDGICAGARCADVRCADVRCADVAYADVGCESVRCEDVRCEGVRCEDVRCADVRWQLLAFYSESLTYRRLSTEKLSHKRAHTHTQRGFYAWKLCAQTPVHTGPLLCDPCLWANCRARVCSSAVGMRQQVHHRLRSLCG